MQAREQETVSDLLVRLPSMGAYSADDLRAGFGKVTEQLDDLMCDFLLPFSCLACVMASGISHAGCQMHDASVCIRRLKVLAVQQSGCVKVRYSSRWCRMDAPLAPKLCAGVLGRALLQGVLPPDAIPELCKPIEGGEVRRALVAPALQYVKVGE